jgi:hypothetical protein
LHEIRTNVKSICQETWNDCPQCGEAWKDPKPTPGLLHRTVLCDLCKQINKRVKESAKGYFH